MVRAFRIRSVNLSKRSAPPTGYLVEKNWGYMHKKASVDTWINVRNVNLVYKTQMKRSFSISAKPTIVSEKEGKTLSLIE